MTTMHLVIVLMMSYRVTDAAGYHGVKDPPLPELWEIADNCAFYGEFSNCVETLLVESMRESGHKFEASHDNGRGCGAFGVLCTYAHGTWRDQVRTAWGLVLDSA